MLICDAAYRGTMIDLDEERRLTAMHVAPAETTLSGLGFRRQSGGVWRSERLSPEALHEVLRALDRAPAVYAVPASMLRPLGALGITVYGPDAEALRAAETREAAQRAHLRAWRDGRLPHIVDATLGGL